MDIFTYSTYVSHSGYADRVSLTLAVGIVVSLFYSRRTGWSTGGLVTPGLLALQAADPLYFSGSLALAALFAVILRPLAHALSLYGRERVGAALLLAISFRLLFRGDFGVDAFWIGWIALGLVAADMERQGLAQTLAATVSASLATAAVVLLLLYAPGYFAR